MYYYINVQALYYQINPIDNIFQSIFFLFLFYWLDFCIRFLYEQ
jgi:hypothetical protein